MTKQNFNKYLNYLLCITYFKYFSNKYPNSPYLRYPKISSNTKFYQNEKIPHPPPTIINPPNPSPNLHPLTSQFLKIPTKNPHHKNPTPRPPKTNRRRHPSRSQPPPPKIRQNLQSRPQPTKQRQMDNFAQWR